MTTKSQKLIPLYSVMQEMRMPGKDRPINPATVYATYLPALGIIPVNREGHPKARTEESFITEAQAEEMRKAFRLMNWRKFKAVEQTDQPKGGK